MTLHALPASSTIYPECYVDYLLVLFYSFVLMHLVFPDFGNGIKWIFIQLEAKIYSVICIVHYHLVFKMHLCCYEYLVHFSLLRDICISLVTNKVKYLLYIYDYFCFCEMPVHVFYSFFYWIAWHFPIELWNSLSVCWIWMLCYIIIILLLISLTVYGLSF